MFQKFNLLLLALIILLCRSVTANWPSEFHEVASWNFGHNSIISQKSLAANSGDQGGFYLSSAVPGAANRVTPLGEKSKLLSAMQVQIPDNFAAHKFLRFNLRLILQAKQGDFHFSLRNRQGEPICQVTLNALGQVWVLEKVDGVDKREQVGTISLKSDPMDLLVGVNLETTALLIKVDGASCRPLKLHSLNLSTAEAGKISAIGWGFSSFASLDSDESPFLGELLHFGIDEAKI